METFETRVDSLERAVRQWRSVTIGLGIMLCCLLLMGQTAPRPPEEQEAHRIIFRDAAGKVRLELGAHDNKGKCQEPIGPKEAQK